MLDKIKNVGLSSVLVLICALFISQTSFAQPYSCIPTCHENDGKMLLLAQGATLQTINNQDVEVGFLSPEGSENIEIGIFDGDDRLIFTEINGDIFNTSHWDREVDRPPVILRYELIMDPEGNGSGNGVVYRTWSSDGSFGENVTPLPDNEWFVQVLPNVPEAQTADGSYSYRLEVSIENPSPDPTGEAWNAFKVRSDGVTTILAGSAFNYIVPWDNFLDFITIYPNIMFFDRTCINSVEELPEFPAFPGGYCDPADPDCCIHETTSDGTFRFCMLVPEGLNTLDIWDGDLDYGSSSFDQVVAPPFNCIAPDGIALDTDDPNTPIALPPWSAGTDVVQQGVSVPTAPQDDAGCFRQFLRTPSLQYDLVGPNGERYTNVNPSGNLEWELFNLSTEPFDPALYDIQVDDIPGGQWCIEIVGNDLRNLNSFRLPFDMYGLDENDNPVFPPTPMPTGEPTAMPTQAPVLERDIPTLNVWGSLGFVIATLFASVYYLRRKRTHKM